MPSWSSRQTRGITQQSRVERRLQEEQYRLERERELMERHEERMAEHTLRREEYEENIRLSREEYEENIRLSREREARRNSHYFQHRHYNMFITNSVGVSGSVNRLQYLKTREQKDLIGMHWNKGIPILGQYSSLPSDLTWQEELDHYRFIENNADFFIEYGYWPEDTEEEYREGDTY